MTEQEIYEKAVEITLAFEGYKTVDTGGRIIYGISEKSHPNTVLKIWDLPEPEAKEIAKHFYYVEYWKKVFTDNSILSLPGGPGLMVVLFDTAVNLGVKKAMDIYRAIPMRLDCFRLTSDIIIGRLKHYSHLAAMEKYKPYFHGWVNRIILLSDKIKELEV